MAVQRRCPQHGLLHHSDRGCTCEDYRTYLASLGITCSMSRRADCHDTVEGFYNQRRRHSTLGLISPAAFERQSTAA
jgi:putative transposase